MRNNNERFFQILNISYWLEVVHPVFFSHNLSAPPILKLFDAEFHGEANSYSIGCQLDLNWLTRVWIVLEIKIPIFKAWMRTECSTLRHCHFSILNRNLTSNYGHLNTSIKCNEANCVENVQFCLVSILCLWFKNTEKVIKSKDQTHYLVE